MRRFIPLLIAPFTLAMVTSASAQLVSLDYSYSPPAISVGSTDSFAGINGNGDILEGLPYSSTISATNPTGDGSSTIISSVTDSLMTFQFNQSANANEHNTGQAGIYFVPTENLTYALTGSYGFNMGESYFTFQLQNLNTSTYNFNDQENGSPGAFTVGGTPNDGGSFTGTLIAGDQYQLLIADDANNQYGTGQQSSTGTISFALSPEDAAPVPEPSTWALLVTLFGGLLLWRRNANKRA